MGHFKFQFHWQILLGSIAFMFFTACAGDKSGSNNNNPNLVQPICPPNQVNTPFGCQNTGIVPGSSVPGYYSEKSSQSNMFQMNEANYKALLKDGMGVCDRCQFSSGLADCKTWINGFNDIVILNDDPTGASVELVIRSSYEITPGTPQYSWNFPRFEDFLGALIGIPPKSCNYGTFTPKLRMRLNVDGGYNSGKGFVASGTWPFMSSRWNRRALRLYVDDGKLGVGVLKYRLVVIDENYREAELAQGDLAYCQTHNCGGI